MSIAPLASPTTASAASGNSARPERAGSPAGGVSSTLADMGEAVVDGVSATVSLSGKALHALERAGESLVDGAQDVAAGAWHAVQRAAEEVEHAGAAVVDAVEAGVHDVVSTASTAAKELGHYAAVGLQATGDAVSELAGGTVMAASAGGKTLMAIL